MCRSVHKRDGLRYTGEFPSGRRRYATTQHHHHHPLWTPWGRDTHTRAYCEGPAGGVARAYMHIHTAAKCHTQRWRARIYTRTQRHSRRVAPPCGQAEAGDEGRTKGEEGRSEEWGMRKMEEGAEREREERSTWKLCGGVKLQRPPRCLPFAGDIRNSSVVTAPNRGVDPLDRCIYTMGGRGKGDAPLTRNARSPRTPRPVIFTRHEVFRRLYRRSLRRERERTKFRDLFSPLAFSFQDFQEARDGGKSMKKGKDWIPVSKKQKIGNPKSRRGFRSYSSFPVFAYTEEGRETMRLMGKVEIRSKGRRRREHATTTRRDRDIYIYI